MASRLNLFPHPRFIAKTIDVGGAGSVSALLDARRYIGLHRHDLIAVVAGDAITSLSPAEFLRRADSGFDGLQHRLNSPIIPNAYNKIAEWYINKVCSQSFLASN